MCGCVGVRVGVGVGVGACMRACARVCVCRVVGGVQVVARAGVCGAVSLPN